MPLFTLTHRQVDGQQDSQKDKHPNSGRFSFSLLFIQVDEVKDIMTQNIEKVLDRGEKIEILVDKTEELTHTAESFQKSSTQLKRSLWWKDKKWTIVIVLVVLLVIGVIVLAILGSVGVI